MAASDRVTSIASLLIKRDGADGIFRHTTDPFRIQLAEIRAAARVAGITGLCAMPRVGFVIAARLQGSLDSLLDWLLFRSGRGILCSCLNGTAWVRRSGTFRRCWLRRARLVVENVRFRHRKGGLWRDNRALVQRGYLRRANGIVRTPSSWDDEQR